MHIQIQTKDNKIITTHVNYLELIHKTDIKRCTFSTLTQDNVEISIEEYKRVVEELKKLDTDIIRRRSVSRDINSRI